MKAIEEAGLQTRKEVMGEEYVARAMGSADELSAPLQEYINAHAWGSTWQRDDLSRDTRSLVTIAMLTALKASQELKGHIRGALNNGCTLEQIRGVILHSAVYCGAPAAIEAMRTAQAVFAELNDN